MQSSNMKNMVILKNLPSNLIEEAIVILKSNKKLKKLEKVDVGLEDSREIREREKELKENDKYIIREAEMIISKYLSNVEEKRENDICNKKLKKKYKKMKKYAYILAIVSAIQFILLLSKSI